jgi:peptide/nickel transport system ATP-binding protein
MTLLSLSNLDVHIGEQPILKSVSLEIKPGQIYGLAGESGSGKSITALSIMGLLPPGGTQSGSIVLDGEALGQKSEAQLCAIRGRDIGMVFQEPMSALNPLHTIGDQVAETVRLHNRVSQKEAMATAVQTLERVGLPAAQFSPSRYPHDLSGGQRQRVGIAIAIALRPKLLIADEPTTALDVTIQAQILDLLRSLVRNEGMALMLITHDLAVMAQMADHLAIMQAGNIVESGEALSLLRSPSHPYSQRLLHHSTPRFAPKRVPGSAQKPVLQARNIVRNYPLPRRKLWQNPGVFCAVNGVKLIIKTGERVGLVGESGCGKSTLLRTLLALDRPQGGEVILHGEPFARGHSKAINARRRQIQMVFQDPFGSFNPRHTIARLVSEPFHLSAQKPSPYAQRQAVEDMLDRVGLKAEDADKYPHEFSGGQRQRIAIARALIIRPSVLVLDEAVSALDVSMRAQILDLLADISDEMGLAVLFVSHDLAVIRSVCERVLVMHDGKIVEQGATEDIFRRPKHAYTRGLIAATPDLQAALCARKAKGEQA